MLHSVVESEDLSSNVAGSGFVVVHDTLVGGEDDVTELSGGEDGGVEVLELGEGEVESGGDDTALVESTVELDNDLSGTGIIDDLELVDVAMALHASEELNEHLGDGAEEDLYGIKELELETRCLLGPGKGTITHKACVSESSGHKVYLATRNGLKITSHEILSFKPSE